MASESLFSGLKVLSPSSRRAKRYTAKMAPRTPQPVLGMGGRTLCPSH